MWQREGQAFPCESARQVVRTAAGLDFLAGDLKVAQRIAGGKGGEEESGQESVRCKQVERLEELAYARLKKSAASLPEQPATFDNKISNTNVDMNRDINLDGF